MNGLTPMRWFRFRLSTVLILTAIAAWWMASLPFWDPASYKASLRPNPLLTLPALALAMFVLWKAARE
ncbi:MAG: hypothetical protein AB7O68_16635 [Pirellulales bacterium]